jgi:hypothetical protein
MLVTVQGTWRVSAAELCWNVSDSSRNMTCFSCRTVLKLWFLCRLPCDVCWVTAVMMTEHRAKHPAHNIVNRYGMLDTTVKCSVLAFRYLLHYWHLFTHHLLWVVVDNAMTVQLCVTQWQYSSLVWFTVTVPCALGCRIAFVSLFQMCASRTTSLNTTRPYTIFYRLLINWASLRRH